MQLTELLFQKVKDLGAQGQLALTPGYVAVVSKAAALRAALVAPLYPGPDDQRRLVDGNGPTRVGVGMLGGDGTPYRVLRELGGARTLQRFDELTRKFANVSEDPLEIDSFLRVECGLPPADVYTGFFVLEVNELPSLRGRSAAAAGDSHVDQGRVKALREELVETRRFEVSQDRLFKVQQRILELQKLDDDVQAAEAQLAEIEAELGRSPWTPEEMADLAERAAHAKEHLKTRDEALAELVSKRQRALRAVPPPPEPFLRNPWFGGGIAAGLALDLLALLMRRPFIALFGLIPYAVALIAVLRFLHDDEADKDAASWVKESKDREEAVKRAWDEKHAPLRAALKASGAGSPEELLELFKAREAVSLRRDGARAEVEKLRGHPELPRVPIEVPLLETEKTKLEDAVHSTGFSRAVAEIETDLKHAMGLSDSRGLVVPESEVAKNLVARAADLMNLAPEELWDQMGGRLSAYLVALTDKRVVMATPDATGLLVPAAADGRTGPYLSLPTPLRDLVYVALRLTLLEKVASYKRVPVVIDDAFATLEPAKRALVAKMLKGISAQTQIIHRSVEPPPPATADVVLQA